MLKILTHVYERQATTDNLLQKVLKEIEQINERESAVDHIASWDKVLEMCHTIEDIENKVKTICPDRMEDVIKQLDVLYQGYKNEEKKKRKATKTM